MGNISKEIFVPSFKKASDKLRQPKAKLFAATGLAIGSSMILDACSTPFNAPNPTQESRPALSVPAQQIEEQMKSGLPMEIYRFPGSEVPQSDVDFLVDNYGGKPTDVFAWVAMNKGPVEQVKDTSGDKTISFKIYGLENGRQVITFPDANENYNNGRSTELFSGWFSDPDSQKVFFSYYIRDAQNPQNINSVFLVEWENTDEGKLTQVVAGADPISVLGDPEKVTLTNPLTQEQISYSVGQAEPGNVFLDMVGKILEPSTVAHAQTLAQGTPPPTEAAGITIGTPTAEVAPTEIVPGVQLPEGALVDNDRHEIRDASGKLIYTADLNGKWIGVNREITINPATQSDWDDLGSRLGANFIYENGLITGVEGVKINNQGEVELSLGNDVEVFQIGNIKVQNINGQPTLLVAGYSWNSESKSWDVFNPGFPMENPKDELGWFLQSDVANGNWLRWHQRATQEVDFKSLFAKALKPDTWFVRTSTRYAVDINKDGKTDILHSDDLWFTNPKLDKYVKKTDIPGYAGNSFGFLNDSQTVMISYDALNKDDTITSLPIDTDAQIWSVIRNGSSTNNLFVMFAYGSNFKIETASLPSGFTGTSSNIDNTIIWPGVVIHDDSTIDGSGGQVNVRLLAEDSENDIRSAIVAKNGANGILDIEASLQLWGCHLGVFQN